MKKLIILAFFEAGLQWAAAQNTGFYFANLLTKNGIVRDNNIVYFEEGGKGYFAYTPSSVFSVMTSFCNRVEVPDSWYVRDFRVVDGVAYFCGVDKKNNTALLGHFVISNLFYFPGQVVFYKDANIVGLLATLNRIAVKSDKTTTSIMAIGNTLMTEESGTIGCDRVLYIDDYAGATGCIFSSNDPEEVFWDVVATENCFAVAGEHGQWLNMMTMRRVPFGTPVVGFLASFGNLFKYSYTYDFTGGIRITHLVSDEIATVGHYIIYPGVGGVYTAGHQFSVIDVINGQMMNNQISMGVLASDSGSYSTPGDMVYVKHKMALMMVDKRPYIWKHGVLWLDPYATSFYMPNYYYYTNDSTNRFTFNSVAELPWVGCVVTGGAYWMVLDFSNLPALSDTIGCISTFTTDMFPCMVKEPMQEVSGTITPYYMMLEGVEKEVEQFFVRDC